MPKGPNGKKCPADAIGNVVKVMQIATDEAEDEYEDDDMYKAAQVLGRKGGKVRAEKLSKEQRSKIAKTAASARWNS
ncbi:MAG: hypothetical protein MN733_15460 [Nitrososphaera sp.]|nr:hypothetical protein [Nitrososphaera sp.]